MYYTVIVDPDYEVGGDGVEFDFKNLEDAFSFIKMGLKANNRVEFCIYHSTREQNRSNE